MSMKLVVESAELIDYLWRGIPREVMWNVNDLIARGELKDDCEVKIAAGEWYDWEVESECQGWEFEKKFSDENGEMWKMWKKEGAVCMSYEHCDYDEYDDDYE